MNLVTIATFIYPHEAAILKSRLESEGISCFMKDENTLQVQPFYTNAIGGAKVQVKDDDVIRANKIVEEYYANMKNANPPEITEEEYMHDDAKDDTKEITCPLCGSDNVHMDKTPVRINLITVLLMGLPLIFLPRKKYHCFNCGNNFKRS
jgi:hypothetical protein